MKEKQSGEAGRDPVTGGREAVLRCQASAPSGVLNALGLSTGKQ